MRCGTAAIEAQTRIAVGLKEHQRQLYTIHFLIFDPGVLVAAVLITSPMCLEQHVLEAALETLRKGSDQLAENGKRVKLAEKGAVVLKLLIKKASATVAEAGRIRNVENIDTPVSMSKLEVVGSDMVSSPAQPWMISTPLLQDEFESRLYGPINTNILYARELEDILASVQSEMEFPAHGAWEEGMYWHNLLHVPF